LAKAQQLVDGAAECEKLWKGIRDGTTTDPRRTIEALAVPPLQQFFYALDAAVTFGHQLTTVNYHSLLDLASSLLSRIADMDNKSRLENRMGGSLPIILPEKLHAIYDAYVTRLRTSTGKQAPRLADVAWPQGNPFSILDQWKADSDQPFIRRTQDHWSALHRHNRDNNSSYGDAYTQYLDLMYPDTSSSSSSSSSATPSTTTTTTTTATDPAHAAAWSGVDTTARQLLMFLKSQAAKLPTKYTPPVGTSASDYTDRRLTSDPQLVSWLARSILPSLAAIRYVLPRVEPSSYTPILDFARDEAKSLGVFGRWVEYRLEMYCRVVDLHRFAMAQRSLSRRNELLTVVRQIRGGYAEESVQHDLQANLILVEAYTKCLEECDREGVKELPELKETLNGVKWRVLSIADNSLNHPTDPKVSHIQCSSHYFYFVIIVYTVHQ
jgi:hypothetical protein